MLEPLRNPRMNASPDAREGTAKVKNPHPATAILGAVNTVAVPNDRHVPAEPVPDECVEHFAIRCRPALALMTPSNVEGGPHRTDHTEGQTEAQNDCRCNHPPRCFLSLDRVGNLVFD